ncbi:MAG: hypothetical protein SGPRY_010148, partial [Prymnesium sp.]
MPSRAKPLPSRAKPAWDGTIHDLRAYRASPLEQLQRRQRYTSPHAQAAKREVRERRALLERSGGFEERLCELAQSAAEEDTTRARGGTGGPAHVEIRPVITSLPEMPKTSESVAPPRCHSTLRSEAEPPAALREVECAGVAYGSIECAERHATEEAAPHDDSPVVDLESEIASFHRQTGAPPPAPKQKPAHPRPAWGSKVPQTVKLPKAFTRPHSPSPAPPALPSQPSEQRTPDALGLARLQHACSKLESTVAAYEQERSAATSGGGGCEEMQAAALSLPRGGCVPGSFSACNARILEMVNKLVAHLRRADTEVTNAQVDRPTACLTLARWHAPESSRSIARALNPPALTSSQKARDLLETELREVRACLEGQKAQYEEEISALRYDLVEVKALHGVELRQLTSRLTILEATRNGDKSHPSKCEQQEQDTDQHLPLISSSLDDAHEATDTPAENSSSGERVQQRLASAFDLAAAPSIDQESRCEMVPADSE